MARNAKYCSFCGRPNDGTVRMVNGPGVCICENCIKTCSDIIKEQGKEEDDGEIIRKPKESEEPLNYLPLSRKTSVKRRRAKMYTDSGAAVPTFQEKSKFSRVREELLQKIKSENDDK